MNNYIKQILHLEDDIEKIEIQILDQRRAIESKQMTKNLIVQQILEKYKPIALTGQIEPERPQDQKLIAYHITTDTYTTLVTKITHKGSISFSILIGYEKYSDDPIEWEPIYKDDVIGFEEIEK